MRTSLVIPCYNESEGVAQLCRKLETLLPRLQADGETEVIFVDDGSTDGTIDVIAREATGLPHRVVVHERNRGVGAALRTGLAAARGEEIVTLDSDCTYDPAQVPELLAALRAGADVVTASPYHPRGAVIGVPAWRLFLSRSLSRLYWLLLPRRLYTYTSCFRAYRRSWVSSLASGDDGFLGVAQLLVVPILLGCRVAEVPATLSTRRYGQSKIRVAQVIGSHLIYLGRLLGMRAGWVPRPSALPPTGDEQR